MKKKNLNVPLTKHNKDKKIKKIYKKFAKTLFLNIEKEKFCIAVSGGPDSLSLSYLSYCYAKKYNIDFKALIVNHNLRKYSLKEANLVRSILSGIGISSKILSSGK